MINIINDPKKVKIKLSPVRDIIQPVEKVDETVNININSEYSKSDMCEAILHTDINQMNDKDLTNFVSKNYSTILEITYDIKIRGDILNDALYNSVMSMFTNNRFIIILNNVLQEKMLSHSHIVYINRIIYNYMILNEKYKNAAIEASLNNLGTNINSYIIALMDKLKLPKSMIVAIAVARNSSFDEDVNIKRVNFCLFNSGRLDILPSEKITDIYQIIFNASISLLFNGIMFDIYSPQDMDNATSDQREIYGNIGNALLQTLEQLPMDMINNTLVRYAEEYSLSRKQTRFSLKFLSSDFSRINSAIELAEMEGIMIP